MISNVVQWGVSLFTTGGKWNPLATVLLVSVTLVGTAGYFKFNSLLNELEISRQAKVVIESCNDKTVKLNEARNEESEAHKVVDSGRFDNDYLKRLQDND
jgi:hypothetical protein